MRYVSLFGLALLLAAGLAARASGDVEGYADKVSSLVDPAKLATLGTREANPRVEKYVAMLAEGKAKGAAPKKVAEKAVAMVGMKSKAAKLTVEAMLRNLTIADRLGCLDSEGLAEMHRGHAPTVRRGPYHGEKLSVDHIIPIAVAPELDNVIANLELMPLKMNEGKNSNVGARQVALARDLHKAGLLGSAGLAAVEQKAK
jgi:hypothetical protein